MKPIWELISGEFAGWRSENDMFYDPEGFNVGYFKDGRVYLLKGTCLGQLYEESYIGRKSNVIYKPGRSYYPVAAKATKPLMNRDGHTIQGWEDPRV